MTTRVAATRLTRSSRDGRGDLGEDRDVWLWAVDEGGGGYDGEEGEVFGVWGCGDWAYGVAAFMRSNRNPTRVLSQRQVINIFEQTKPHHPNFALLLGAGASKTSGVRTAVDLVQEWREQYKHCAGIDDTELRKQPWFDQPDEYSQLFEELFDTAAQRREIVESWLDGKKPSWGYMCLVSLLKNEAFNTVLTTNFDDLLNEACYLFSEDVRPIVCAHDSAIRSIRITSKRPKIIKLHGDFLFDNIKNTSQELESLEHNTRAKFQQFCCEYGLLVVGYGGRDRSVMDVLDGLLRREDTFHHGVYWGVRKGDSPSKSVDNLRRFEKFHLFNIDGFDEFFADLHEKLGHQFPQTVVDPSGALKRRISGLLHSIEDAKASAHPTIASQIAQLQKFVEPTVTTPRIETVASTPTSIPIEPDVSLPSDVVEDEAIRIADAAIRETPTLSSYAKGLDVAWSKRDIAFARKLAKEIIGNPALLVSTPGVSSNISLPLINLGLFDEADQILELGRTASLAAPARTDWDDRIYLINKSQILRHKGHAIPPEDIDKIKSIAESMSPTYKLAASLLLGQFENAENWFEVCLRTGSLSDGTGGRPADVWPLFRLFPKSKVTSETVKNSLTTMFGEDWSINPAT